ncbi:MAG: TetR family transcriptional regulator [Pseudonocardiaceae bacterium]|nr:TetR family transcriptional regulator [Pseudonocardiaceae bacterium]
MAGDAEATRRRLLDAAAKEFAEHGSTGARVDRIAAAARSNKAQIYHYFMNKDGLFDAVLQELAEHTLRDARVDGANLPEYAGRLFDRFADDPRATRLADWYRLAGKDVSPIDLVVASPRETVAVISKAQDEGRVPTRFTPVELLALVVHLASMWSSLTPELASLADALPRERRRQVVVDAVTALLND